jgi:hypothetical protein
MPLTIDLALEDEFPPADESISSPMPPAAPATLPELDPIAALEVGQRLAMCVKGDWTTATLVWRSDNGQFLLFAGGNGGKLSVTRRSFQRLLDEGPACLPDAGRALASAAGRIANGPH